MPSPSHLFDDAPLPEEPSGEVPSPEPVAEPLAEVTETLQGQLVRYVASVSYVGADFKGFARQEGLRTVAGVLEEALSTTFRHPISLTCAGRTDGGVHALAQVISFDAPATKVPKLVSMNRFLPPDVRVSELVVAPEGFDARRSARYRHYVYRLSTGARSAVLEGRAWQVDKPLDLAAMRNASYALIGEHDFFALCKSSRGEKRPTIRRVFDVVFSQQESTIDIALWANSFCQQMVRSLVGTFVDIGLGKRPSSDLRDLIRTKDRALVRSVAPPYGLYLYEVGYDEFSPRVVESWSRRGFSEVPSGLTLSGTRI